MKKRKITMLIGLLLAVSIIAGIGPVTSKAAEKTYVFLNPLGKVEPRSETPLADRSRVTDILNGTGERTLRLGISWYTKPLDGEPAIALGEMLKEKWEAESADPANRTIPEGLTVKLLLGQSGGLNSGLHPWNNKTDSTYDNWAANADGMIVGVGD